MNSRILILAALLSLLAGCATPSPQERSSVPDDTMPAALESWSTHWDDDRRDWHEHATGKRVGQEEVPIQAWTFESDAIAMRLRADSGLNQYRGKPHTLLLHVYQVRNPGGISRQLETPAELRRLLRRGDDDPDVLDLERVIIGPGQEILVRIDRADQARYLVLVAAYADLEVRGAVRIVPIPQVYDIPRGRERFAVGNVTNTLNPFSSTPAPRPGRLNLWLDLGETRIRQLDILAQ